MTATKRDVLRVKKSIEPVFRPENVSLESQRVQEGKLARRLTSLKGARVGFYNNHKPFAAYALPAIAEVLKAKGVRETFVAWATTSNKPSEQTLANLAKADAVILASAD